MSNVAGVKQDEEHEHGLIERRNDRYTIDITTREIFVVYEVFVYSIISISNHKRDILNSMLGNRHLPILAGE